jgi:phosphoglycerate-specific signal transduction histidine kinase
MDEIQSLAMRALRIRIADAAAEIATLRQKLAAAEARIQEMSRHNATAQVNPTEADKDNAFKPSTSSRTPTLDDLRERMAALNCEIAKS